MVVRMKITAVAERVGAIAAVRADPAATADVIESGLVAVREVQASQSTECSKTLSAIPKLAGALGDAATTADHVDAVTRVSRELDACKHAALIDRADALAAVAKPGAVDEFARRLDLEAKRLQDDGMRNLGCTTRLVSRAQRRALRGRCEGCAIPGYTVAYDRCALHHIICWRNGGHSEHGPNRQLALRLPAGSVHTIAPSGRSQRRPAA